MLGEGNTDKNLFTDAIFSFRRLTLSPLIVLIGYIIVGISLFKSNAKKQHKSSNLWAISRRTKNGNRSAFDILFDRYAKKAEYYFYRMLWSNEEKAADFTQDLFLISSWKNWFI